MRMLFAALAALGLAAAATAAAADTAPKLVMDDADALTASAARLDEQVSARQSAGDMAAAQRLVLASAMMRRAAFEFHDAEQAMLMQDANRLPATVLQRMSAAIDVAAAAEKRAAADPAFLDQARATFNALLAALPMKIPHPVIYGLLSRDLADAPLPSDIVVYGYRLIDPVFKTAPTVIYGKSELPSVAVSDEEVDVTLPDRLKRDLDFAPSACESRAGFKLGVQTFYAERRGLWPISWNTQLMDYNDLFVLPTPVFYTARIVASLAEPVMKFSTVPFEAKSELATAECEESRRVQFDIPLPQGATNPTCSESWVQVSGASKLSSHCEIEGRTVHVSGQISGGGKVCTPENLCSCVTSAQGFLSAQGAYRIEGVSDEVKLTNVTTQLTFVAGRLSKGRLAVGPGQKLNHVALDISRRECPTTVDTISLNVGDDPEAKADSPSKSGVFRAVIQGDQLTLGAADAYPMFIDKLP